MDKLDRQEGAYNKTFVDLQTYDGRTVRGFIYTGKPPEGNPLPTKRYMGVIIKVILFKLHKNIILKLFSWLLLNIIHNW